MLVNLKGHCPGKGNEEVTEGSRRVNEKLRGGGRPFVLALVHCRSIAKLDS